MLAPREWLYLETGWTPFQKLCYEAEMATMFKIPTGFVPEKLFLVDNKIFQNTIHVTKVNMIFLYANWKYSIGHLY